MWYLTNLLASDEYASSGGSTPGGFSAIFVFVLTAVIVVAVIYMKRKKAAQDKDESRVEKQAKKAENSPTVAPTQKTAPKDPGEFSLDDISIDDLDA